MKDELESLREKIRSLNKKIKDERKTQLELEMKS